MNLNIETHHVGDYTGREHVLAGDPAVLLNIRPVAKVPTARRELLEEAADLVDGDRNRDEMIGTISLARISEQMRTLLELGVLESAVPTNLVASKAFLPSTPR